MRMKGEPNTWMGLKEALILFCIAICLIAYTNATAVAIPNRPVENVYVFDFADIISGEDEEEIRGIAQEIDKITSAQIIVVTVNGLEGKTIEEYSLELFRMWGIGNKEKNNGILILVNKENLLAGKSGRIRIEVGYGLEGAINDGKAGYILDNYALPNFENKDYSKGIKATFMAVANEVAKEYNVEITDLSKNISLPIEEDKENKGWDLIFLILLILIIAVLVVIIWEQYDDDNHTDPTGKGGHGKWSTFFGGGSFGGFGGSSYGGGFGGGACGGGGASR